jgi:hypothetical protein
VKQPAWQVVAAYDRGERQPCGDPHRYTAARRWAPFYCETCKELRCVDCAPRGVCRCGALVRSLGALSLALKEKSL